MRLTVRTSIALLALATLAAYANSFTGAFVFDDHASIVNNPTIRDWRTAFFPPNSGGLTVSGRPLLNASFAASYALSGTAPWGHHVVNLLIHTFAGLALFGLVRRTFLLPSLTARYGESATPLAFFIALLWTLHPLQTESVTYVVQRAESLMGLFVLLTLYAYVRGLPSSSTISPAAPVSRDLASPRAPQRARPTPPPRAPLPYPTSAITWFSLSIAACLLGVATKEVTVVAPLLVVLHDRAFAAGSFRAAWQQRRALYCGLLATWLPLAALVLGTGGNRGGTSGFDVGVTALGYWLTQFEALTRYLALSFWPAPLVFEYGTFFVHDPLAALPYALVVLPLAVATLWALWRRPALGFLGTCFFAVLAPTSIVPGSIQMIVEHRMYLPLAAVLTLTGLAGHSWLPRRALWPTLASAAIVFAVLTIRRNFDYHTELSLWTDTLAKRPANAAAHNGVGIAQLAAGQNAIALIHFEHAVRLAPRRDDYRHNHAAADNGRAVELLSAGNVDAALQHFGQAVQLAPSYVDYLANYAGALARAGRPMEAITRYEEALRLRPDYPEAHTNLSLILGETGRLDDALAHADTAIRLLPGYAPAHLNRGIALLRADRAADASAALATALRLDPTSPEAHNTLGVALIQLGRAAESAPHFETALRLRPDYPQARDNLARLRTLLRQ